MSLLCAKSGDIGVTRSKSNTTTTSGFQVSFQRSRQRFCAFSVSIVIVPLMNRTREKKMKNRAVQDDKLRQQSVEIEGSGGARRCNLVTNDVTHLYDDVSTVYEAFLNGIKVSGDGPCLGSRKGSGPYQWMSYSQIHERAANLGCGLLELGCQSSQETYIGVWSKNCVEWFLTDMGCQMFSMVTVPIYDTHGPDACIYIIQQASLKVIVCNTDKVSFLLEKANECDSLKTIILIGGPVDGSTLAEADELGIKIHIFEEIEELGKNNKHPILPPGPNDVHTISWTSGTTGYPKGALVTHGNIISNMAAYLFIIKQDGVELNAHDVHLSYLPPEHMYERCTQVLMLSSGARIGFSRGKRETLMEDFQELKPTVFSAVPRLLNVIYDKVTAQVLRSKLKKWIFDIAMHSKQQDLKRNILRKNTIWDRLVFKKIQNLLGGNVRIITCGSAPLSANVTTFIRCVMGCYLQEGYGQTETTAIVTMQRLSDFSTGHVGAPAPCNQVKLVDVPEMGYYAKDGHGEICVKGQNVFKGYLGNPEKNAECFDDGGWFHSGDIGQWNENGTLKIIDRKKHIFKLSQGEYIAPEKIQNAYLRSPYVAQVFVHGYSLKSCIVGVVVPDQEMLFALAKSKGIQGDLKQLCQNQTIRKLIHDDMLTRGKDAKLNSLEQVKAIYLSPNSFTIEEGLVTPTMKVKRQAMAAYFDVKIQQLYDELEAGQIKKNLGERKGW
ncbi:long-chain-fatty-acid--CoA ligase 1-like [Actinia tenebrosa]|uniref:Long-chain-fatty-acid--CoA ligase n=1 Tax=Actinia tenebrosa TaxID=6105 RepID=A0A6P8GXA0_ACTTE|nr:long-chain-fatty-acid--CoA ligase 1-like [Actinia tenebrosa]